MVENNFGGLSTKIWSKNLWDYLDIGRLFPKGKEYGIGNHDSEGIEYGSRKLLKMVLLFLACSRDM